MTYPNKCGLLNTIINKRVFFYLLLIISLTLFSHGAFATVLETTSNPGAHFFDPSSNDQSLIYLGEIFGTISPVLAGTGSSLMGDLFGVFNSAVLMLGIFFLGYTAFVGVLNTAGDGEMLGKKWSSLWVPIRMVGGLGLIIPTSTGYCVCQVFVMWLIIQGIGAADTLTQTIVDYMKADKPVYVVGTAAATSDGSPNASMNKYDENFKTLYTNLTCMQANQKDGSTDAIVAPAPVCAITDTNTGNCSGNITYTFTAPNGADCGKVEFIAPTSNSSNSNPTPLEQYTAAAPYMMDAVDMVMPSLNSAAYYMVHYNPYLHEDPADPTNDTDEYIPSDTYKDGTFQATYDFVGSNFMNQLQQTFYSYVSEANSAVAALSADDSTDAYYDDIASYGWVSLGGIYWYMAKSSADEDTTSSAAAFCPATEGKTTCDKATESGQSTSAQVYIGWGTEFISSLVSAEDSTDGSAYSANSYDSSYGSIHSDLSNASDVFITQTTQNTMATVFDELSNKNQNPLIAAQKIGHSTIVNVETAMAGVLTEVLIISTAAGISASISPAFLILQAGIAFTVPIMFAWLAYFYVMGGLLDVVLPFLPAAIYFLAVCNWMLTVVESLIAAPIVAIGALHAEGHEVWGKAEPAIMLLANMFLRPSLIVIGMATGILLSFVAFQFINFAFFNVMKLALSNHDRPIELMLYLSTYTGILLAVTNQAFTAVNVIPDQVLRWISGGESARFAGSGGADHMGKFEQQQGKGQEQMASHVKASESGTSAAGANVSKSLSESKISSSKSGSSGSLN